MCLVTPFHGYPFTAPAVRDFTNVSDNKQKIIIVGTTVTIIAENIPFKFFEYAVVNCPNSAGNVIFSLLFNKMEAKYLWIVKFDFHY